MKAACAVARVNVLDLTFCRRLVRLHSEGTGNPRVVSDHVEGPRGSESDGSSEI